MLCLPLRQHRRQLLQNNPHQKCIFLYDEPLRVGLNLNQFAKNTIWYFLR